jgi:hypothetical protein
MTLGKKETGYVPPKPSVKPLDNTERRGYVPPKPPAKPPTNKK